MTLFEWMHSIVAAIGLTETILLLITSVVGVIYVAGTRQLAGQGERKSSFARRGNWLLWLPLAYCVYGIIDGVDHNWRFYAMMLEAGAFNESQAELFRRGAIGGALRLFRLGVTATLVLLSARRLCSRDDVVR